MLVTNIKWKKSMYNYNYTIRKYSPHIKEQTVYEENHIRLLQDLNKVFRAEDFTLKKKSFFL